MSEGAQVTQAERLARFMEVARSRWNLEESDFDNIERVLADPECFAALPRDATPAGQAVAFETEILRGKVAILEGQLRAAMLERKPLEDRRDGIGDWITEYAPYIAADQKHLDEDTPERAYWHYGYRAALVDVLNLVPTASPPPTPAGDAGLSRKVLGCMRAVCPHPEKCQDGWKCFDPMHVDRYDIQSKQAALQEAIDVFEGMHDDEIDVELLPRLRAALAATGHRAGGER